MNDKKIYIILLNYNGIKDTKNCIESINKNEKNIQFKIIVVDNCSTDNSIEELKKIDNIILIKAQDNGGFAKGNNVGIKYAMEHDAQYIILLNNDTEIEENAISILVQAAEDDSSTGIIGSRIMYFDNKELINYCGGKINWLKCATIHENYKEKYVNDGINYKYTEFITGCSMLIKREVIKKIGYLPEEYFMYYEDADYCVKAKENGYKLGLCTNSIIYHKVSVSSGGENSPFSIKWGNRNRLIFMNKYRKYSKGILSTLFYYITRLILFIKYNIKGQKEKAKAIIEGMKSGQEYVKEKKNGRKLFNKENRRIKS